MQIIEITEGKASEMAEHAEKVLKHGGKLMQCIEELCEGSRMGERYGGYGSRYGNRQSGGGYSGGNYGSRYGMREEEMRPEDYERMNERGGYGDRFEPYYPPYMGERRYRSASTGRYVSR